MKILLIKPSFYFRDGRLHKARPVMVGMTLPYLAALLKGHDVRIIFEQIEDVDLFLPHQVILRKDISALLMLAKLSKYSKMKKTTYVYILKETLPIFFIGLMVFTIVLLMDKILKLIELVVNRGGSLSNILMLFLFNDADGEENVSEPLLLSGGNDQSILFWEAGTTNAWERSKEISARCGHCVFRPTARAR
jgi:hypothetical protein